MFLFKGRLLSTNYHCYTISANEEFSTLKPYLRTDNSPTQLDGPYHVGSVQSEGIVSVFHCHIVHCILAFNGQNDLKYDADTSHLLKGKYYMPVTERIYLKVDLYGMDALRLGKLRVIFL